MEDHYKELHEKFVSGNEGSSHPWEILLLSVFPPISLLLVEMYKRILPKSLNWMLELILLNLPILLSLTCCSEVPEYVLLSLLILLALWVFKILLPKRSWIIHNFHKLKSLESPSRPSFLDSYRSSMLLVTSLTLLAVDFPVFPRRFAKTETYGYGLMDIGVGSFVFAAGILALEARDIEEKKTKFNKIYKSLSESVPLLTIGIFRMISVKALSYQEHLSEYGVHWNFFFTLAITKVVSSLILNLIPIKQSWIVSLLIELGQEGMLSTSWGASYILDSTVTRTNFFSSNKEGILSIMGYVAIYIAGVSWGQKIYCVLQKDKGFLSSRVVLLKTFGFWAVIMWSSLFYSQELFLLPSRRMANWSYFNWMLAYNLSLLFLFTLVESFVFAIYEFNTILCEKSRLSNSKHFKTSKVKQNTKPTKNESSKIVEGNRGAIVLNAIVYNGLPYFLLSNLFTGIVNMSIHTLDSQNCYAILILLFYIISLEGIVVYLKKKNIRWK